MSKSLLQTRIVDKLEVIMTQVDTMNKFGKNIPLIHLDVLKSNIRMLYEQICELERGQTDSTTVQKTVNSMFNDAEPSIASKHEENRIVAEATQTISKMIETIQEDVAEIKEEIEVVAEIPAEIVAEIPVEVAEIKEEFIAETISETVVEPIVSEIEETPLLNIETIVEETVFEQKEEVVFEDNYDDEPPVQNAIPDIFSSLQTIVDRYKTPDSTLNEAMAISNSSTVNTAVKQVRDLKSSIGINEKFLFINELFKGNMKEYTDTIVALSDTETLESVHEILAPLKSRYGWRDDSDAYATLIDFLQRRFV